jgi:hypothetical protein
MRQENKLHKNRRNCTQYEDDHVTNGHDWLISFNLWDKQSSDLSRRLPARGSQNESEGKSARVIYNPYTPP